MKSDHRPERIRVNHPTKSAHDAKWQTFAKQFPSYSLEERDAFKKNLAPEDRITAIEALLSQSGPDGIDQMSKHMINEILKNWSVEDFNGAWKWSQGVTNDRSRRFIAGKLLDTLVVSNQERALSLHLETIAVDSEFYSQVPTVLLSTTNFRSAEQLVDFLGQLPPSNGSSGRNVTFDTNFDFQSTGEKLAALIERNEGRKPDVWPSNFLSSWAGRDPDAAFEFFATNKALPFDDFSDLLNGIEQQGVPGAAAAWVVDKLESHREVVIKGLSQIARSERAAIYNSISLALPDAASREQFRHEVEAIR